MDLTILLVVFVLMHLVLGFELRWACCFWFIWLGVDSGFRLLGLILGVLGCMSSLELGCGVWLFGLCADMAVLVELVFVVGG